MLLSVSLLLVEAYITLFSSTCIPLYIIYSGFKTGHCFFSDIFTYMFIGGIPLDRFAGGCLYVALFVLMLLFNVCSLLLMFYQRIFFAVIYLKTLHPYQRFGWGMAKVRFVEFFLGVFPSLTFHLTFFTMFLLFLLFALLMFVSHFCFCSSMFLC